MITKIKNKKGAIELSFQFIFSVILIIAVLFFGFFVIRMFLNNVEKIKLLQAVQDIRNKVNEVFQSDGSSQLVSFKLNSAIQYICFANVSQCNIHRNQLPQALKPSFCNDISLFDNKKNLFFYPIGASEKYKINSAQEIYCGENNKNCLNVTTPACFENIKGKIIFRIEKPNENSLVYVREA